MRKKHILPCLAALFSFYLSVPALAQNEILSSSQTDRSQQDVLEQAAKVKVLQQDIDEQQKNLDTQQIQLDSQKKELHLFRQQLDELSGSVEKTSVIKTSSIPPRRNDLQTNRRDDAQPHDDWQGSFAVTDSNTRIKIGGFLELDVIHDTDAIRSKGQFIPSTIPTRNATKQDGTDGQTNFSVSPSRLFIETRTLVDEKRVKTFLSIDMYGDELGVEPELRLRQAYVDLTDILFGGDLLIGQAWSTSTDLEAAPDVLDFRGVDNLFGSLVPQVRWTREVANGVKIMIAAETANNHIIEGADSLTRLPDGVFAVTWDSNTFNLMASLLIADLRASLNNGPVASAVGYGGSLSGKVKLPFGSYQNDFLFSVSNGIGVGSHYQNAHADAVYDTVTSSLEPLENFGVTLGYALGWSERLTSTFTYCCIEIYNNDAQSDESLQATEYASANLVWNVNTYWLVGVEGLWGKRKDKDNTRASNFRTQFTSRLSF